MNAHATFKPQRAGREMPPALAYELADELLETVKDFAAFVEVALLAWDEAPYPAAMKRRLERAKAVIVRAEARIDGGACPHCGKPADTNVCGVGGCPLGGDL